MSPQIYAAIISACGTIAAATGVSIFGVSRISTEIRQRHRADNRRELFIATLKDAADFVRESNNALMMLGSVAFLWRNGTAAQSADMEPRFIEAMGSYARAGALIPPELLPQREHFSSAFSDVAIAFHASGDRFGVTKAMDDALDRAKISLGAFTQAFEQWKAEHWDERP